MSDLHWLSASDAVRAFAARRLSPVELVQALLARIDALDPSLNVFIRRDDTAALAAARVAEAEIAAGRIRGPLHGVPVGIKDIIDVAGLPTTCHSRVLLDNHASTDAVCVARLRQAGAIVLGKLSTHEFAIGGPSFDLPFPPARNPWNRDHHPGGSIRNPASACGIVGLKPTYGLVSRRGVFPLAFTLDHVGPMTRTVADNALLLDTLAGHDPQDPGSRAAPKRYHAAGLERGVRGLRIGFVRHFHQADLIADPDVDAALEAVARSFTADGAIVSDVTLPTLGEFAAFQASPANARAYGVGWRGGRHRADRHG